MLNISQNDKQLLIIYVTLYFRFNYPASGLRWKINYLKFNIFKLKCSYQAIIFNNSYFLIDLYQ